MDLIFFQLISDILGYLRFVFPYGIHIIASAPKTPVPVFILQIPVPFMDEQAALTFQKAHKPCHAHLWWDLYQHMYMIRAHFRFYYFYPFPLA